MELACCAICLDPLDENDAARPLTTLPSCGHKMHTECALKCAWKGNISCPTCRRLPLAMDEIDVEDNRERAIDEHNDTEMQKHFVKGIRMANAQKAPLKLKTAVAKYRKHMEDVANEVKQQRFFVKAQNDAIKEINAATRKIKDKHKVKVNKSGYNGAKCMRVLRVETYKMRRSKKGYSTKQFKREVARAVGWTPVCLF